MIETERLIFRYLKDDDLESVFYNYANDDEVTKYLTWPTHKSLYDTKMIFEFWKKEDEIIKKFHYFLELKNTHELIGSIALASIEKDVPEIGYVIGRKWWNKGIMTEACKKFLEVLFDSGFTRISIKADVENIASNRVIEKCGFKFIKKETVDVPLKNKEILCNYYELDKSEWNK